MHGVEVTIKKNVHVDTYAPQAIARFLHQGGLLQSLLQLLGSFLHRSAISSLSFERSSRDPTFFNLISLWGAPSGVPILLFWNRIIFVIVFIILVSTSSSSAAALIILIVIIIYIIMIIFIITQTRNLKSLTTMMSTVYPLWPMVRLRLILFW